MNENKMIKKLKSMLTEEKFKHSLGVRDTAVKLAKKYSCDEKKALIAGLLHDCAKNVETDCLLKLCCDFDIVLDDICKKEQKLIHGPLGTGIAKKEFDIYDKDILDAIYYHTFAKKKMSLLTKIIYIADYIEPNRDFKGVDKLRDIAFKDLNKSIVLAINGTIKVVLSRGSLIHPNTIDARNYIIMYEL